MAEPDYELPPIKELGIAVDHLKTFSDGVGADEIVDKKSGLTGADLLLAIETLDVLHEISLNAPRITD